MEHEKKKRNKKKKNKQGKANESHQNNQNLNSGNADVQNRGVQQTTVDSDRESINGAESVIFLWGPTSKSRSVEAEKSYGLNREASLEQKIKELQEKLDVHVQREDDLERNISLSQNERSLWHHKETELENRIVQLETEKDSWLQKEAGYEEKINRLVEETATLRSMGNSTAETIASLNKDNVRLRAQVFELEASGNNISHQNQQLKEHVSDLQSKIQELENSVTARLSFERKKHATENEGMNSELKSARSLVSKLFSENEKLIETVNTLNSKLDQKSIKPDDPIVTDSKDADVDESSASETDPMTSSTEKLDTVSNVGPPSIFKEKLMNPEGSDLNHVSRVSMESGEIVQISLDEGDVTVAMSATNFHEKTEAVPLMDAPLIGAPFRFISFVSRYVSGADLVQK